MSHLIQMTVSASLKGSALIFRILNFKEDVHRELLRGEYGTVAEPASMDNALAPVTITLPRKRHYAHMTAFMADALDKHAVGPAVHLATEHT